MTIRRQIIDLLEKQKMTVRELILYFRIEPKEITDNLEHIKKSVLPKKRLIREHALCRTCGFIFKDRVKLKTPSKCPKCRAESITEPKFYIK